MEDNNNALQGNALPSSALPSNAVQGDTMQFLKPPRGFGKVWYILYPILIFFGLTFLVQIIAMIIMAVSFAAEMPMTGDIAQYSFDLGMKVGEAAAANIVLIQTISYFLLAGLFFLLFRRDIKKRGLTPDKPARNGALPFLWMALTVGGYSIFFVSLVNITKLYEIFPEMMSTDLAIAGQSPILVIILTTVITPFTEELFFRGLLFKRLRGMLSFIPSAIISSIIFGIAHGSVPQFFYTFLLSILFCYIYEKYGSLLITIYCHFVLNSVIMVVNYAFDEAFSNALVPVFIVSGVVFIAGLIPLLLSLKKLPVALSSPLKEQAQQLAQLQQMQAQNYQQPPQGYQQPPQGYQQPPQGYQQPPQGYQQSPQNNQQPPQSFQQPPQDNQQPPQTPPQPPQN